MALVWIGMTVVASASSSSSFVVPHSKYDVFLSFRGDDTRKSFICHLYKELLQNGIITFMDDKIKRGEKISSTLFKAAEESKVSLVIFSKNYASSTWCLDELVHMLHCAEQGKQVVIPIFYDVEPSSVRKQSGIYHKALAELEEHLEDKDKIDAWRKAMKEAAGLSGWDSRKFRSDSELVEEIVKDVLVKLDRKPSVDHDDIKDPVGLIVKKICRIKFTMSSVNI